MAIKKSVQFKDWRIDIEDSGAVKVSVNGEVVSNTKASLREISAVAGMIVEEKWNTQQLGAKLVKFLTESTPQAPVSATKVEVQPKVKSPEVEAARIAAAKALAEAEAKAAKEELARIKAETEKAKKDAEVAKAALEKTKKEAEALKAVAEKVQKTNNKSSNDPFEGLMIKVSPGLFYQKLRWEESYKEYPNGDHRKKPVTKCHNYSSQRRVVITKSFLICKYPVTQKHYKSIMGEGFNPSAHRGNDDLPVECVSWQDIQRFLEKLNKLTGKRYRLPTEAEWEWAALGASKDIDQGDYSGFSNIDESNDYAWLDGNSGNKTHPVGEKKPNELGIYDMMGNVWEYCQDNYVQRNKACLWGGNCDSVEDPCIITDNHNHVTKGGCFWSRNSNIWDASSESRATTTTGFRVALDDYS